MGKIAIGQYKMVRRPVSGIVHIIVYLGFIIINIEVVYTWETYAKLTPFYEPGCTYFAHLTYHYRVYRFIKG